MVRRASVWFVFLSAFLFAATQDNEVINVNEIVDSLLEGVTKTWKDSNTNTLSIPNLEKKFKIGFLEGGFEMGSVVLGDLATMKRSGDVFLIRSADGKSATFSGPLTMENLELNVDDFEASFSKVSVKDKMSIKVNKNIANITVSVASGEYCVVTVDDLKMIDFGGFVAILNKIRWMKFGEHSIASWMARLFENKIREAVENKVKEVIDAQFKQYNLCAYFLPQENTATTTA